MRLETIEYDALEHNETVGVPTRHFSACKRRRRQSSTTVSALYTGRHALSCTHHRLNIANSFLFFRQQTNQLGHCSITRFSSPLQHTPHDPLHETRRRDDDLGTPKAKIDPEAAWNKYRATLIKSLTKASDVSKSRIQVLTVPIDATWDEEPEKFSELCDQVPFASGFYESSGYTIREQYRNFINNINKARDNAIVSNSDKKELDKWSKVHASKIAALSPARRTCATNFMNAKRNGQTTLDYDQYEISHCPQFQKLNKDIEEANMWIEWHSALAYGVDFASLVQSRMQSKEISSMEFKEFGTRLADFKAGIARGESSSLDINFSLTSSDQVKESYDKFVKGMKRPSSLTGSMFSLMSGPSAAGLSTSVDVFKMKLSFKAWKKIRVVPGDWFASSVVEQFKNGPFIHRQANLFGSGGSMTLMPKAIYVAVQPKVEMTVNKEDSFRFNKSVQEGKSGLFSSKSVTAKIDTKFISEDTYKLTITSLSKVPQVIAIDFDSL